MTHPSFDNSAGNLGQPIAPIGDDTRNDRSGSTHPDAVAGVDRP